LAKVPPRIIRTDEQNEAYIDALYQMEQHQDEWTTEESELADLLTLLIEDFEDKHYSLPKAPLPAVLEFLMEQQAMDRSAFEQALGVGPANALLQGHREPQTDEIRKLAAMLHVSPDLFF